MKIHTIDEDYEYRLKHIIKKVLKDTGAEAKDFASNDDLLEYLYSKDIAQIFGQAVVDDMTEWSDEWLAQVKE